MQIDYRTLPPRLFEPNVTQEDTTAENVGTKYFTDPLRPPSPASGHYWDVTHGCWLPLMGRTPPIFRSASDNIFAALNYGRSRYGSYETLTPAEINEYIKLFNSPSDIRDNYSDYRNEVAGMDPEYVRRKIREKKERNWKNKLFAKTTGGGGEYASTEGSAAGGETFEITLTTDPSMPSGVVGVSSGKSYSYIVGLDPQKQDLTGREDSDKMEESVTPTKGTDVTVLSRGEAEAAYKYAAAALAKIEELERKYSPDLPNDSVIAFRLTFPATTHTFSYVAIRAVSQWFASGKISSRYNAGEGVDWSVLLECFERFQATDFEVLRVGQEIPELEAGSVDDIPVSRTVVLPSGASVDAFPDNDYEDEVDGDDE